MAVLCTPGTSNLDSDVEAPYLSRDGAHSTDFQRKSHREKLNFLKEKGLCFGFLCKGHISKDCKGWLSCKICNRTHPSVLHINPPAKGEDSRTTESPRINEGSSNVCGRNRARNSICALSTLPVQVKSVKNNKVTRTCAFCTERLAHMLGLAGKPTTVLLSHGKDLSGVHCCQDLR